MQLRVYYEDTDIGGIVYHTNYIKYCERARSELFFQKGIMPIDEDGAGFVVRHIDADFLGMASLGDMLEVKSELLKKRSSSIILKQSVWKESKKIFEMDITLVFIRHGKPIRISKYLIDIISSTQN